MAAAAAACGPIVAPERVLSTDAWRPERGGLLVSRRQAPDLSDHASALRLRSDLHHERRRHRPAPGIHRQGPHHLRLFPAGQQAHRLRFDAPGRRCLPHAAGPQQGLRLGRVRRLRYLRSHRHGQDRKAPDRRAGLRRRSHGELEDGQHRLHVAGIRRSRPVDHEDGRQRQEADHEIAGLRRRRGLLARRQEARLARRISEECANRWRSTRNCWRTI